MEVVWQVEVDDWCRRVLERHWPDVARFRDVRECHGAKVANTISNGSESRGAECEGQPRRATSISASLPPVDLICGGFPCQPVSHAGQRKGESDSRWLWPEFYRIVCEVQPRWVIIENVPGLRSIDSGRLFRGILWDLSQAGFDAVWTALSAADVGAPHLRERVFIIAHANDDRPHGDDESERQHETMGRSEQPGRDGGDGQVADADFSSVEGVRAAGQQELRTRCQETKSQGLGSEVAYTPDGSDERSGSRGDVGGLQEAVLRSSGHTDDWSTQCRLGLPSHGLSKNMDCGGWECGVPRVIKGQKNRVNRLRGLGNAVVPQVAEVIGRWIMETA